MHAAVLHTIGAVPRYEEFPEPVIGGEKIGGDKTAAVSSFTFSGIGKVNARGTTVPQVCTRFFDPYTQ